MDLPHSLHGYLDLFSSPQRRSQRLRSAVAALELPEPVFKTCPWQPRELVETGLRQWLLCCGVALGHRRVIGMPSRAVDEARHGLILCTATYSAVVDTLATDAPQLVPHYVRGLQYLDAPSMIQTGLIPLHPGAVGGYRTLHG